MARGTLIPSSVDLTDSGNVVQARHELHQATDFGDTTKRAAWAEKWGEAALAAGEKAARAAEDFDGFEAPSGVFGAQEIGASLAALLAQDKPDLVLARRRLAELNGKINDVIEAFEE